MKSGKRTAPWLHVSIKQEHIDAAIPCKARTCAVAVALAEKGALRPNVDARQASFTMNGERFRYIMPVALSAFIREFDKNPKSVRPVSAFLKYGTAEVAKRTGGPDRTQKARHALGGRQARHGYCGPRTVLKKLRSDGFITT